MKKLTKNKTTITYPPPVPSIQPILIIPHFQSCQLSIRHYNPNHLRKHRKTKHINRQRLLVISSRGITYRHRHLIQDLLALLPHARKEPKFDSKKFTSIK